MAGLGPVHVIAADPASVTGMFVASYDPTGTLPPPTPLNIDEAAVVAHVGTGMTTFTGGDVTDYEHSWSVSLFGSPSGQVALGPVVGGYVPHLMCSMLPELAGEVLEADYADDGSLVRFAADITGRCAAGAPESWMEIRYHSTVGLRAYAVEPLAREARLPPDLDLGDAMVGGAPASGALTVTNTGSLPLALGSGTPPDPAFQVAPGSCDGASVAPGETCQVDVIFTPTEAGTTSTSIDLIAPELPIPSRPLRVQARGTEVTSVSFRVLDAPEDWMPYDSWDLPYGSLLAEISWAPAGARLDGHITTTCGVRADSFLVPEFAQPLLVFSTSAPAAGPCDVTLHADGTPSSGWLASEYGPVHFIVPDYVDITVGMPEGPWARPDQEVVLTGAVTALNGVAPDGGTLTIEDETAGTDLLAQVITPGDDQVELHIPPGTFSPGIHVIRMAYEGDPVTAPRIRRWNLVVDADLPSGTAEVAGGRAYASNSSVNVHLAGADPTSDVTTGRLANSPTVANGRLVAGTDVVPNGDTTWSLAAGDGVRRVYVQWRDTVGHWSTPIERRIVVDTTRPTVGTPTVNLVPGVTMGSADVPVKVAFTATDTGSGLASASLQVSRDEGAWTALVGTGTTRIVEVRAGHAYRFRGVARDRAGNQRVGPASGSIAVRLAQETSTSLVLHGTWQRQAVTGASGGYVTWSRTTGSSVTYSFWGRSVAWVAPMGPTRGSADVFVDGRFVGTFSLWHATTAASRLIVTHRWTVDGSHTIRVVVRGTPPARIDVDAFAMLR